MTFCRRQAVGGGVLAHLDADPAPAHLVGDGGRGAGAEEAVEDQVAGVGGNVKNALKKTLGLGCCERGSIRKQSSHFVFGSPVASYVVLAPEGARH